MQRHHLLPRQLLAQSRFSNLLKTLGRDRLGFDDFRTNGLLLPSRDEGAIRLGLPLHRGPHRRYNEMVAERVGQIEACWTRVCLQAPEQAASHALMRMDLLQRALRRRLLAPRLRRFKLNQHDPLGAGLDFSELDAMVEGLWAATEPTVPQD